jgi:histidinol-phosphate aminotransferase
MAMSPPGPVARSGKRLAHSKPLLEDRLGKLRLDFNENTVGCSPSVVRALARLTPERLAMYPEYSAARARFARHFRVALPEIVLTNGIDDGLRLLAETYLDPGDTVLVVEPTFNMYRFYAELRRARVCALRYGPQMQFPLPDVLQFLRGRRSAAPRPKVMFLANPNNPTGTLLLPSALLQLLRAASRTLILVDEAYADFSGSSVLPWIRRYPNLIVARTFSKAMGLAGLRLGCLFARRERIAELRAAGSPFPVNTAAIVAAQAACRHPAFVRHHVREILRSRALLERGLARLGVPAFPSAANFLLADFGSRAPRLLRALARRRILLRDRAADFSRIGYVRITVGTPAQTRRLLRAIEQLW